MILSEIMKKRKNIADERKKWETQAMDFNTGVESVEAVRQVTNRLYSGKD